MEELIQKVHTQICSQLNNIYKKRKQALFFQKLMWLLTGLFFVLMLVNMGISYFPNSTNAVVTFFRQFQSSNNPYFSTYPIFILVGLVYVSSYVFANKFRALKLQEVETIPKMVKLLFPGVEFTQNISAPSREIMNSKLFAWIKQDSPMYSYGQIRSNTQENQINIADIGITEQNVSNKLINTLMRVPIVNMLVILYQYVIKNVFTSKSADTIYFTFRGMFCWLRFKKILKGHTVILTNNADEKINRFFSNQFKNEERVYLEDPRFTNEFIVYSTNQVEARYVLSMAFMEKIVALKEKFDQPILLSFQNQQMYLAVKNEHGLFSFPAGKLDAKTVEELANDINTALEIATEWK